VLHDADDIFEFLILALLSVNQYSLEKTWSKREALRTARLLDPTHLAAYSSADIAQALKRAGVNRGDFMTDLFASRMQAVGQFVVEKGQQRIQEMLETLGKNDLEELLLQAQGIGPRVVANFLLLRDTG
jgi:hypothetical protein